MGSLVKITFLV